MGSESVAGPGVWHAVLRETASWAPVPDSDPLAVHSSQARPDQGREAAERLSQPRVGVLVDVGAASSTRWALLHEHQGSHKCCVASLVIDADRELPQCGRGRPQREARV